MEKICCSSSVFPTPFLALPLAVEPLAPQQPVEAAAEAVGDDVRRQAPRHVPHRQSHRLASGRVCGSANAKRVSSYPLLVDPHSPTVKEIFL